jgi:hypothetical protein
MSVPGQIILSQSNPGQIRPDVRDSQASFFWGAPPSDGGSAVTSYILSCTSPYVRCNYGPAVFSDTVMGLTNGIDYQFEISASNAIGAGPPALFRSIQPGFRPAPPQNVTISIVDTTSAQITWATPASNGDARILGYTIVASNNSQPTVAVSAYPLSRQRTVTGLLGGDPSAYEFRIYTVNDPGYSTAVTNQSIVLSGVVLDLESTAYTGGSNWPDSSSNANNATLTTGTGQVLNGYALFDGSSYFTALYGGLFMSNFSFSLWFEPFSVPQSGSGVLATNSNNILFLSDAGGAYFLFGERTDGSYYPSATQFLLSNTWNNITITNDGTDIVTYLNNSNIGTFTPGLPYSNRGDPTGFLVGGGVTSPINGLLGQVLVYNRALTSNEVARNYNATVGGYVDTFPWTARYLTFLNYSNVTQNIEQGSWQDCWAVSKALQSSTTSYHFSLKHSVIAGGSFFGFTSNVLSNFNIANGYELLQYQYLLAPQTLSIISPDGTYINKGIYTSSNVFTINCTSSNVQILVDGFLIHNTSNALSMAYYLAMGIVNATNTFSNIDFGAGTVATIPPNDYITILTNQFGSQGRFVNYLNGRWISAGGDGTSPIKYSGDGFNWSNTTIVDGSGVQTMVSVAYSASQNVWVATGYVPEGTSILYSGDGMNWSNIVSGTHFNPQGNSVVYSADQDLFVAGGFDNTGGSNIKYSSDGSNWLDANVTVATTNIYAIHYGGGIWHAPLYNQTELLYSPDGINWSNTSNNFGTQAYSVAYNGTNVWVAVGNDDVGGNPIKYSGDGIIWSNATLNDFTFPIGVTVRYSNNLFIASGSYASAAPGVTAFSSNGTNWYPATNPFNGVGYDIAYGDGIWLAVGDGSINGGAAIKYSRNGSNWYNYKNGAVSFDTQCLSVAFADNKFVMAGIYNPTLYTIRSSQIPA